MADHLSSMCKHHFAVYPIIIFIPFLLVRRWKRLFPKDVPLLSAARKIQKSALISNFVDRESERPALGPSDFLSLHMNSSSESDHIDTDRRKREARYLSRLL